MKSHIVIIVAISILLVHCKKEDKIQSKPEITTHAVAFPDDGGVILKGELSNHSGVDNHGFILLPKADLSSPSDTISLGIPGSAGEFSYEINTGLSAGHEYHFRAFAIYKGEMIQGDNMTFLAGVNKPPKITGIYPEPGHIGDTVEIRGIYFETTGYAWVRFSDKFSQTLSVSDSLIVCVVPETVTDFNLNVVVTFLHHRDSISFRLHRPVIEGFYPETASIYDTVVMMGQHFDFSNTRNMIHFGSNAAEIISSSRNRIEFIVPEALNQSSTKIRLFSQRQYVFSNEIFQLKSPEIIQIPDCAFSKQEITIIGKDFHPLLFFNKVWLEGIQTSILSASTTELNVRVPIGPFPRGFANIEVEVLDLRTNPDMEFCIEDHWLMISNSLPFNFYNGVGSFTIGNDAWVISIPENVFPEFQMLWKFNPDNLSWQSSAIPFDLHHHGACVSAGNMAYVYTATQSNNFFEFDPVSMNWTKKADFPGTWRGRPGIFSIQDEVYIGLGQNLVNNNQRLLDFYKYNPFSDEWIRISDLNLVPPVGGRYRPSTFVIDDVAYLACGNTMPGTYDSWKYLKNTDEWMRIADFPDSRNGTSSFEINNKGYVINGGDIMNHKDCWEYDPVKNTWTNCTKIAHTLISGGFAFKVSEKVYTGVGSRLYVLTADKP